MTESELIERADTERGSAPSSGPADHPTMGHEDDPHLWPPKHDVLGVQISDVDYDAAVRCVMEAARRRVPAVISCHAVHAVVTISEDPPLRRAANGFAMITPDGQPVRWALNWLHRANLRDRVYGPELMRRLVAEASSAGVPIYLFGGTESSLDALSHRLRERCPSLTIAGCESPPFRDLTDDEHAEVARRINASGAGIVFIGLGCPKQDRFAARHANTIEAVQVCVGAAFDFHAGTKPMAPLWMQRLGLEWVFRLASEPRRLWKRYLVTNTKFVVRLLRQYFRTPSTSRRRDALNTLG